MPQKYKPKPLPKKPLAKKPVDVRQDKQLDNLKKRIKRIEHSDELKYNDLFFTNTFDNNGVAFSLASLAQGDDSNNRVGEEINAKYLNFYYRGIQGVSIGTANIRIVVFWDMQANALAPTFFTAGTSPEEGLLDDTVITSRFLCPANYRTKQRYKILYDKTMAINPDSTTTSKAVFVKKSFNLGGAKVKYADSGATLASLTSRALYILCVGSTGNTMGNNLGTRFWYTDP